MNFLQHLIHSLKGNPKPPAYDKLRCLFVTDAFSDKRSRLKDFKRIKEAGYNAVYGLLDLQIGQPSRPNVVKGRTMTLLTSVGEERIDECLYAGLTPIVGTRNDWAIRNKRPEVVPSIGIPAAQTTTVHFYGQEALLREMEFCNRLIKTFGNDIGIQLAIEAMDRLAAPFYRQLADHILKRGFKGPLLINLLGEAQTGWTHFPGVVTAHTYPGVMKGKASPHAIFNTDGDNGIHPGNANEARKRLMNSGKGWILWADCNIRGSIDPAFTRKMT